MSEPIRRPTPEPASERMRAERVQFFTARLSAWEATDQARRLERTYELPSPRSALLFCALAQQVAQELGATPRLTLDGTRLVVISHSQEVGGVTARDVRLAFALEHQDEPADELA